MPDTVTPDKMTSSAGKADAPPLTLNDLKASLAKGCKPAADFRIGSEHEKFVYRKIDFSPAPYEPATGIRSLLEGFMSFNWKGIYETKRQGEDVLIALSRSDEGGHEASISLEPGGQFELSGAPLEDLHKVSQETEKHFQELQILGDRLGLGCLTLGFIPHLKREEIPIMPKDRYSIMRAYMPKVGNLGLDMMLRTSTVQVNLDFSSEDNMIQKFRVSLALQPLATALFANSPFIEGKPSGWLSSRARVWTDTDPDRTGLLDFVFDDGFGFETYVQYALDVPMYFIKRNGFYIDLSGQSFRDFLTGNLAALPGQKATLKDWEDHLTTIFPEVRLKTYLEMRGADTGDQPHLQALSAFWTGLLYDPAACQAALDLVTPWTREERHRLRLEAARFGLKAEIAGRSLKDIAKEVVAMAKSGLKNRAIGFGHFTDETHYLDPLEERAETGLVPADHLLALYHGPWHGDITRVFASHSYW